MMPVVERREHGQNVRESNAAISDEDLCLTAGVTEVAVAVAELDPAAVAAEEPDAILGRSALGGLHAVVVTGDSTLMVGAWSRLMS